MNSLFGIPMNAIMVVLLVLLGISLATVAVAALRNRVMFLVGLRNIPRRRAQTTLIIIGLMLSTLIISAAFTTGDTVDYSISSTVYDVMGHVDEVVQFESKEGSAVGAAERQHPLQHGSAVGGCRRQRPGHRRHCAGPGGDGARRQ